MRKAGYFLTSISFLIIILAVGKTSFAWECVGPADQNCLQCHAEAGGETSGANTFPNGYLHQNPPMHKALLDISLCLICHCGEGSYCHGNVETHCCTSCHEECPGHDECLEVNIHTNENSYDCGQCHFPPEEPGDCAATGTPTLSEWGMIIFMTIIMGIGVVVLRKRRIA